MKFVSATMKRLMAAAAVVALCAPLAACSAGDFVNRSSTSADEHMPSARDGALLDATPNEALLSDSSSISVEAAATAERSIISSGEISLEVGDARAAAEDVTELTTELGGYVESQTLSGSSTEESTGAIVTIRVPSAQFNIALSQLADLGRVLNENRTASDVTEQHVDLQARVGSLETSVQRLTELMAGAATTSELLEAEAALSARQADLDSLKAQLDSLEGQIDEATIWVSLNTKSALPGGPSNFWEGVLAGLQSLTTAGAGALVLFGVLLPWLVIAAIITVVIVLLARSGRRRRQRRASASASTSQFHSPLPADSTETPRPGSSQAP